MHRPANRNQISLLLSATGTYLATAAIAAWSMGNEEFVFYIVVMLVLAAVVGFVHRKVGLSFGLLIGLSFWGLLHMAGGLIPLPESWHQGQDQGVLYNFWLIPHYLKYDQVVHALGFGVTTWLCWQCLATALARRMPNGTEPDPSTGLLILCAAGGMGFGALNEVIEFFATLALPNTNVGGYVNTGWDLVANLVGSVGAAAIIGWAYRPQ